MERKTEADRLWSIRQKHTHAQRAGVRCVSRTNDQGLVLELFFPEVPLGHATAADTAAKVGSGQ